MSPRTAVVVSVFAVACWPVVGAGAQVDRVVVAKVLGVADDAPNLLADDAWRPWKKGFTRKGGVFVCDNGADGRVHRGAGQTVQLNQDVPRPIVATAQSRGENVGGTPDANYALYLDLVYTDGTHLWGRTSPFKTGTREWHEARVVVVPAKPIHSVSFYMLLRGHSGKAAFRSPRLVELKLPRGAATFDGVPVRIVRPGHAGFKVRDVAGGSDFVAFTGGKALGLTLSVAPAPRSDPGRISAGITDTTGKDRAITLVYSVPVKGEGLTLLADPRRSEPVRTGREYVTALSTRAGVGRMSRYPLAAVAAGGRGWALALDMGRPAVYRVGYNAPAGELFIAFDLALTREKPSAQIAARRFSFDAAWGFRQALAELYAAWPEYFTRRVDVQGLWMPFAKISTVERWEDFGFRIKEGTNETAWDDAHGILTFRYTEPMTWWMAMPKSAPRTYAAALAQAKSMAAKGDRRARALLASGHHDSDGRLTCRLRDTPWCNGAVWSMNSAPGVAGPVTDFKNKWNREIREKLYGPRRKAKLDGEYVDSSEGYVTAELNFRRDHFAAMTTPLTFDRDTHKPAILRGLIAFEYVRALEADVRAVGGLMMANGTPGRLCWLAPCLDVLGTETNWNPGGKWRPMSDAEMLFRRALCGPKPYCFLMNTDFDKFPRPLVAKYMKRCLAYGMFPGFFSHNASQGAYFTRPKLYQRDRGLFVKYVPLCKRVAQAGWQPVTLARSSDPKVHVERFGRVRSQTYLTVFNDSPTSRTATITLAGLTAQRARDLVGDRSITFTANKAQITLDAEDVAVLELSNAVKGR